MAKGNSGTSGGGKSGGSKGPVKIGNAIGGGTSSTGARGPKAPTGKK